MATATASMEAQTRRAALIGTRACGCAWYLMLVEGVFTGTGWSTSRTSFAGPGGPRARTNELTGHAPGVLVPAAP